MFVSLVSGMTTCCVNFIKVYGLNVVDYDHIKMEQVVNEKMDMFGRFILEYFFILHYVCIGLSILVDFVETSRIYRASFKMSVVLLLL